MLKLELESPLDHLGRSPESEPKPNPDAMLLENPADTATKCLGVPLVILRINGLPSSNSSVIRCLPVGASVLWSRRNQPRCRGAVIQFSRDWNGYVRKGVVCRKLP